MATRELLSGRELTDQLFHDAELGPESTTNMLEAAMKEVQRITYSGMSTQVEFGDFSRQSQDALTHLATLDPQDLANEIWTYPPSISHHQRGVIRPDFEPLPTSEEWNDRVARLESIAAHPQDLNERLGATTASVAGAMTGIAHYLNTPLIPDGIEKHSDRQTWESLLSATLSVIDNLAGTPDAESCTSLFFSRYNENRYTKNSRTKIGAALETLGATLNESDPLHADVSQLRAQYRQNRTVVLSELTVTEQEIENARADEPDKSREEIIYLLTPKQYFPPDVETVDALAVQLADILLSDPRISNLVD